MKKQLITFITFILLVITNQTQAQSLTPKYGVVDPDDLNLKECSFEKDANAMVLFNKEDILFYADSVVIAEHKRIKLFNEHANYLANVRIPYYAYENIESIPYVEAQTIRLENNKVIVTKVDPALIYNEVIDKRHKAIIFAFPDVKPGCILEYKFKWRGKMRLDYTTWYFQSAIPTRYNELTAATLADSKFSVITKGNQPYSKDTIVTVTDDHGLPRDKQCWAKTNVHSLTAEPFATDGSRNFERISLKMAYTKSSWQYYTAEGTWLDVADDLANNNRFIGQMYWDLNGKSDLLKHAKTLKTDDEKIAYLFNEVKTRVKWNKINSYHTTEKGIQGAWNNKEGNCTEINLILHNLLKKAGLNVYPMLVSTDKNNQINPNVAGYEGIDKTVIYIPVDSTRYYILDASNKYATYNEVPAQLLNTYGIKIDFTTSVNKCKPIYLKNEAPAHQLISINAEIKPDNKVTGSANITNDSYSKAAYSELYDRLGEEKYADHLRNNDNKLKVTDLSFENMRTDSLPLIQKFNFDLELSASDDQYIYFNPNIFNPLVSNPFLKQERFSDIDFGYCNNYSIHGTFKLPAGYKIDVLPQSTTLNMYDKSITLKRVIGENDGAIEVHYTISHKRSTYTVNEYPSIYDFYKKMYQLINEPIVLKKAS